ncbi:nucleotidyl transferase AbiEii/AbiGii toxin family protein [Nocardia australiensis]|uniref:nucleotidyl transferase AbiEii/AbiGii toxin family protein n=1 Tax=Nocardia australiensis TaxID=2887191 RepID=UPI001D15D112|nr:nucleotidyl transferase AbiEii/AbiGii toxin family protein [Nocardia australiensis]
MSKITALWEWIPSDILTALNFGMAYPDGDEDDLFDLGDAWKAAADALVKAEPQLRQVTDATQKFYTGDGAVEAKREFDKLFSGEHSIQQTAQALQELGRYVRKGGTDLEHTKIMEATFAGITVYAVYQLLASLPWGPAAVPLALGTGRVAVGRAAEEGLGRLALEAGKVGLKNTLKPYLKQIAIAGLKMGGAGAGLDFTIQAGQILAGHRDDGFDLAQTLSTGVQWAAGGLVGAPVGMGVQRLLGSRLTPALRGLISGVTGGAAGGFGMYGAGIGYQIADQWVRTGHVDMSKVDTKLQWQMIGAGAALGGMHGVRAGARPQPAPTMSAESPGTSTAGAHSKNPGVVTPDSMSEGKQLFREVSKNVHPDKFDPGREHDRAEGLFKRASEVKAEANQGGKGDQYSDVHVAALKGILTEWHERTPFDGSTVRPDTGTTGTGAESSARTTDSGARPAPADRGTAVAPVDGGPKSAPPVEKGPRPVGPQRGPGLRGTSTDVQPSSAAKPVPLAGVSGEAVGKGDSNLVAGQQDKPVPLNPAELGAQQLGTPVEPESHGAGLAPEPGSERDLVGAGDRNSGAASNVDEFRGDSRRGIEDLNDATVRREIDNNLQLITADRMPWVPEEKAFVMEDGRRINIRVAEHALENKVAEFAQREDGGYDVQISPRARDGDVARAVAHELEEIRLAEDPLVLTDPTTERPSVMTSHLGGRFAELRVLDGQLSHAMFDSARAAELFGRRSDLADLMRRLGLRLGPESADRWALLAGHSPELAGRLKSGLERDPLLSTPEQSGVDPHSLDQQPIAEFGLDDGRVPTDFSDTRAVIGFYNELLDAAKVACEGTGRGALEEVQQFTLQRVLSRIFTDNPDVWVLKGGQSMLARIPDARPSTDIDLVRIDGGDRETMARDYYAALERDHGDYLRFELVPDARLDLDSGGVRLFHKAFIGDREVMTFGIDLNGEREIPMHAAPEILPFPEQIFRTDSMGLEPRLRLLSVQDALAHKVAGMYTYGYRNEKPPNCNDCVFKESIGKWACQKAGSELPYRPQDLADVLVLAQHSSFDGETMQNYLRKEIAWRQSTGVMVPVPERFELPNQDWAHWFGEHLKATDALPFRTLQEALPLADEFLSPLFSREPLHGQWDPQQRRWVVENDMPASDSTSSVEAPGAHSEVLAADVEATKTPAEPEGVRIIEGTGEGPPSPVVVGPRRIAKLDALAGHANPARSLDAFLDRLAADNTKSVEDKVFAVKKELIAVGEAPAEISSMDNKHLRFYSHQSGEEYIHSLALIADRGTTVEIAYQSVRSFDANRSDAHQSHIGYLGELPEGMRADQGNAVAFSRWSRGLETQNIPHAEMVRDLLGLQAEPLRSALRIRDRLIADYGIDPSRIQVVRGEEGRDPTYTSSRWQRAHLFTLSEIRDHPIETRQAIVDAILGEGETAESHSARVRSVLDRLFDAHEGGNAGAKKYTLVWVRDSRPFGQRGAELDTRPQHVRLLVEYLGAKQPDRRIVLVGDNLFEGRPELRDEWENAGLLDVVDTKTLVKFWEPEGLTRAEQALFFHRLTSERNVVQIGMESGALETPTVLGVPTAYTSATEYGGNKANRWMHYSEPWEYGHHVAVTDGHGNPVYDRDTGAPRTQFHPEGEQRRAPLNTIERVPVGPDLPDPANRRGQPVAVYRPAKVSVTASRILSLIETGELDRWSQRLGRSAELKSEQWQPWSDRDWNNSRRYADQLNRWLHTEATTPEQIATKWDAIRLALKGVVEPGYTADETYHGPSIVHPYFTLYTEHEAPAHTANRIATAYAADPPARAGAVADALAETFDAAGLRDQAAKDLSAFRLEPSELEHLHEAIDRVVARNPIFRIEPYDAPPGGSAWEAPGAATHSKFPQLDRLSVPDYYLTHILDGDTGGGHRYGTGAPGKTEFPERWDDDTVVSYIKEIAAAPDRALFQANGYWNVIGARDGVTMTVIVRPDGRVRAAWPEYGTGVFRNPPPGSSAGRSEVPGPA